jgi:hypothetical protein
MCAVHLIVFDEPAVAEEAVHDRVVLEVFRDTVSTKVPVETGLCLSRA